ncbi:hypothetical protein BDZ94DRAFT_1275875 [Collybia nuda]|uniref:Uncharacterized protein n=1 Tax=Collybia nuda TaxID=64659 RepID=A0A9P6CBS4_9AGAR|nr:hypothetical protein BDZ94DRAFT_1275875 [Collybia nuda]
MTRSHNEPPPTPTITLTNVGPAYSPAGKTAKGGPHRGGGPSGVLVTRPYDPPTIRNPSHHHPPSIS